MANTIANFLVGLGLDSTEFDRGQRNVTTGLDSMRSKALQLGALAGGAFGARALTFGFAEAKDNISKFSEVFSTLPDDIQAMGNALAQEGGSLDAFMGQIAAIERLRASTPQQIGALFAEAGIRGVDPSVILNAKSATEAYKNLADVFERLTPKQRLAVAPVFGLDEASIRLLSQGRAEVDAIIERQRQIRPLTEEMTESAAEFNRQWKDVGNNVGGVADRISVGILPAITDVVGKMDDWIDANDTLINSGIDKFSGLFAENITAISTALTLLAAGGTLSGLAGVAKYVPLIGGGLAKAATAAKLLTGIGAGLAVATVAGDVIDKTLDENISGYREADIALTKFIYDLSGLDLSIGDVYKDAQRDPIDNYQTPDYSPYGLPSTPRSSLYNTKSNNQRPIEVKLMLDGTVIDKRIIDVTTQQDEDAYNDITSSTRG